MNFANQFVIFNLDSREAQTNIIELSLSCLKDETQQATGEGIFCDYCKSILNSLSVLSKTENSYQWVCEFCERLNTLNIDIDEIPSTPEQIFILESAIQRAESSSMVKKGAGVVFCIDISGSMCVSKPVQGKINLKKYRKNEINEFLIPGVDDQDFESENITYISRLECVQAAIENQLNILSTCSPNLKVGLVAFNGEVRVIGDGENEEIITGDKLYDLDDLKNWVLSRKNQFLQKTVSENLEILKIKVLEFQENGQTALGPALLISIFMASFAGIGSKVIICTDGLANIGIGSLKPEQITTYYDDVANLAVELGVSVSIITIEGEECSLESLIGVIDKTGGEVNRVAPEKLSEEFSNILSTEILATQVEIQLTLHQSVEFKNEDYENLSLRCSRLEKVIGNVTANSYISFAFDLKSQEELNILGIDPNIIEEIPFQAIIKYFCYIYVSSIQLARKYVNLEGVKCVKVINKRQLVTKDTKRISNNSNVNIMLRAGKKQVAKLVEESKFDDARIILDEMKNKFSNISICSNPVDSMAVHNFINEAKAFEEEIKSEKTRSTLIIEQKAEREYHSELKIKKSDEIVTAISKFRSTL